MSAQPHTSNCSNTPQLRADQVETLVTHALNAPMSVVDSTLRVVYVNASFARWFQRTPAEVTGLTLVDLYGAEALDQIQGHIDRALSGEIAHYQRQIRNQAGEAEWHNVSLSPWLDDEGQVLGIVSIALRVHELKITADALRAANQRLASHMENSPLAVLEMDAGLRLLHCSSRASQWFAWALDEVRGQRLPALLPARWDNTPLGEALGRLQSGQELQNRSELTVQRTDGTALHTVWFNSALLDPQGRVESVMSQVENVTERVMAAEQLWPEAPQASIASLLDRSDQMSKICSTLKLTPAEARVAVLLTEGHPLKRIAQMTHLSIHTVRSQVKSALNKQALHRQVDLVRRVMSIR